MIFNVEDGSMDSNMSRPYDDGLEDIIFCERITAALYGFSIS